LAHFHDLHVGAVFDLGNESAAPKSDGRDDEDRLGQQPPHRCHELRAMALHLSDFVNQEGIHIRVVATGCDDWRFMMALTSLIMIKMNLILQPVTMRSLIQISVSLEILISCFLRSVEVRFS
jgi:hypothetical protein